MRFGVMQGVLGLQGAALFAAAAGVGFEGVELDVRDAEHDVLFTAAGLREVQAASAATGLAVPSVCLGTLNGFGFKDEDRASRDRTAQLIRRTIALCGAVGAQVVLLPFFGHSELFTAEDCDRVAQGLRELASSAEHAGVTLALENTLSAARNLALLEAIGSTAVKVYFDVSNATWWGHDSPTAIRALGAAIGQIHFKDGRGGHSNAMLGEGHVDYPGVARAMRAVGYDGWVVLESAAPTDPIGDARANLVFSRRLLQTS